MSTPPFSLSFSLPFEEAISAAQARGVMLPGAYYGEQPASARRITFSVSGLTALDQVQSVKDQLTQHLKTGGTLAEFQQWAKTQDFNLPRHRLETIYRNAVQTAYNAGHWRSFEATKAARPYLRYDAVNDGRTRPAHRALSGIIRAVDDPFWDDHSPPLGHRCRCRLISLTQQEAVDRSRDGNGLNKAVTEEMQPDGPGWGNKPTAWAETLATLEKQKVEQAGETLGRIAVQVLDKGGMKSEEIAIRYGDLAAPVLTEAQRAARDYVVSNGIRTGNEYGAAIVRGEIVKLFTSDSPNGLKIPELRGYLPSGIEIHHNHPMGDSFSKADLSLLITRSELSAIFVHGHEGAFYYAVRLDGPLENGDALIVAAMEQATAKIAEAIDRGIISVNEAQTGIKFLVAAVILDKSGLIKYGFNSNALMKIAMMVADL